jgi:hypothetical protein
MHSAFYVVSRFTSMVAAARRHGKLSGKACDRRDDDVRSDHYGG